MPFCTHCGKQMVPEWTGKYRESTGGKDTVFVCPIKPCEHNGHNWKVLKAFSHLKKLKCKRCHKEEWKFERR